MAPERITAPLVLDKLDDHLQFHELKLNQKVHDHHVILFGEKGDDGICSDVKEIMKGFRTMERLGYALILMIALDLVSRVMSLPVK